MQHSDLPQFARILNGLAALKPGKPLTPEALDLFWNAMQDWSIEDFHAAANRLAKECEFMPNPYHFEQLRKAAKPTAGEAWARVLAAVRSSAYANGLDPLLDRVAQACGGYRAIGQCTDDGLPFMEKRFVEHYEAIQGAVETREELPAITGNVRLLAQRMKA